MERYIIQLKTRFGYEDLKIFYNKDKAIKYCIRLVTKLGLNVRVVQVVK